MGLCVNLGIESMQRYKIYLARFPICLLLVFICASTFAQSKLTNEELCYLPAIELIRLYRAKEMSPVDVLKAQIERIESQDHVFNSVTFKHYAEALAQAKESERRYRNGNPRPLEGITCALKDDVEVKGWRMTMGSLIRKNVTQSKKDSALTTLLREAGVVMHVQTNVPEYYCNLVTWNWLFGISRNPWNPIYTPGGSSGGSAAALAAGFSTLATGSDMGGSIRFPAAMTALYGFKPPYGRVPTSLTQYESLGPLARNFDDLNLFQKAISGPSPHMISSIRPKLIYHDKYGDITGWRIAYDPMDKWGIPIDKTVKKAMRQAIKNLEALGAIVEEVDLGFRAHDFETYARGIFSTSLGHFCFNEAEKNINLITPYMKTLVNNYAKTGSSQHISTAEDWIEFQSAKIQQKVFLKGFKAIIMPTMCTPYIVADMGSTPENTIVTINDKPHLAATWVYAFTWPWNMLGQYPVINVPVDVTPENIPIGMQIIGNTYDDLAIFQVASNWSKVAPAFYQSNGVKGNRE